MPNGCLMSDTKATRWASRGQETAVPRRGPVDDVAPWLELVRACTRELNKENPGELPQPTFQSYAKEKKTRKDKDTD